MPSYLEELANETTAYLYRAGMAELLQKWVMRSDWTSIMAALTGIACPLWDKPKAGR